MTHANFGITEISTDERSAFPKPLRVGIAAAPVGTLQARTAFHPIANTFFLFHAGTHTCVVTISPNKWSALENTLGVRAAAASVTTLVTGGAVLPLLTFFQMANAYFRITKISTDEWSAFEETFRVGIAAAPVGALQAGVAIDPISTTFFLAFPFTDASSR
jgi:hypothetical protein